MIALALKEAFSCTDDSFVVQESYAIISALNIESDKIEDAPIALVVPNRFTYILEEDYSTVVVADTFPPPLDLDLVFSKHNAKEIIVVQDPGMLQLGRTYGANDIPIRYEPSDIIARGAVVAAERALPSPPASILPLALSVVLHGTVSHIVTPMFSVLPRTGSITLTTVHDNQQTATIEVREGSRARAADNLFLTKLHLEGIPPAPAGTVSIEVTLYAEDYPSKVVVEAVETSSGRKATSVVQRDEPVYAEGVLDEYQGARDKYAEEDARLREVLNKSLSTQTQV
ncbi:78 kDa glucose-regulated protein Short=GRP-78 [Rhizoctonia solani AG-1 IB]|uniref:78 kDa glucose-regulated protein Short=GRP-78 n=1 Tax=Thanatephorus cucumeris (strain AG1-IB / isolate 7/3/14) TaxID=1108050 RepID=M5BYC4_THACB|nr:78 kDa glucose-regulated protein Short=GRP-78 [Rhizoctonia solani AG-1 IB]